jgi:hypothetical protein
MFRNGVEIARKDSLLTDLKALPGLEIYIGGYNVDGAVSLATIQATAGYGVGHRISTSQQEALYNAWQEFNTALGRAV